MVIDSKINAQGMIEMYADPSSRGGIMEPEGLVGVKIKQRHYDALSKRLNLTSETVDKNTLHQIAVHFADLHDTPGRMLEKQVIRGIVSLRESRRVLGSRLLRRLVEVRNKVSMSDMLTVGYNSATDDDRKWLHFYHAHSAAILNHTTKRLKEARKQELLAELASLQ